METRAFYQLVLENLPLVVFVKDSRALRFELVNRKAEELLGLPREQLLGKTDYDFFAAEEAEHFRAKDVETLSADGPVDIEEEQITTPHGVRWLRTRKIAIRDENGAPEYLVGISEDITVRRELARTLAATEQKLAHAQKMDALGKLASGIAHDFNNMLSVIMSCCELLLDGRAPGAGHEELSDIAEATARAAALSRQLLTFARTRSLEHRLVDVNEVVSAMRRMLERVIEEHVRISTVLAASRATVLADPSAIEQIVMNLALNARDAIVGKGTLLVETANTEFDEETTRAHPGAAIGPHVMIAVTDSGAGMDRATMDRVFEPFFTTKEAGRGTGLGLSTVYALVRQAGGTIWVYSELGKGTTFKVYLPFAQPHPESASARFPGPAHAPRGTETILVVEDDAQLLRIVTEAIRRSGYNVLSTISPAEALLISEQHPGPIHLMLTDLIMPLLNGAQLAERVQHTRPEMKVVIMSGYTDDGPIARGLVGNRFPLLAKPLSGSVVLRMIRASLDRNEG